MVTEDFRFFYGAVRALKERGQPFVSLGFNDPLPYNVGLVLTTEPERKRVHGRKVIASNDPEWAAKAALAAAAAPAMEPVTRLTAAIAFVVKIARRMIPAPAIAQLRPVLVLAPDAVPAVVPAAIEAKPTAPAIPGQRRRCIPAALAQRGRIERAAALAQVLAVIMLAVGQGGSPQPSAVVIDTDQFGSVKPIGKIRIPNQIGCAFTLVEIVLDHAVAARLDDQHLTATADPRPAIDAVIAEGEIGR